MDVIDRINFITFLRRNPIFKLFVWLLSNSHSLRRLSIELSFHIHSFEHRQDRLLYLSSNDEECMKLVYARNRQALDNLLDSGLLDPLRALSNVQSFDLVISRKFSEEYCQLQPRHIEMIQGLQHDMKNNERRKQGSITESRGSEQ